MINIPFKFFFLPLLKLLTTLLIFEKYNQPNIYIEIPKAKTPGLSSVQDNEHLKLQFSDQ